MSDTKGELSIEDQERYANGYPTRSQRRKGLLVGGTAIGAAALAAVMTLPSGEEVKPDIKESFEDKDVSLYIGEMTIKKGANLRTSEEISKSNPNIVSWDSVITENGALSEANAIKITNPIITYGHNPDINFPDEQNKSGEWINFWDQNGRWLKVSFSSKTADFVNTTGGEKIKGRSNTDGGFLSEENSTNLKPEEIAVVELVKSDS